MIYCFGMLTIYFGWTIVGAFGIIIIISVFNYFLAIIQAKKQEKLMQKVDIRMNAMTEIVNNIKVIKLNSYTMTFLNRLIDKRR
jgi:nitrogen fixation/metabolism regulation signal transduction histidine kinase